MKRVFGGTRYANVTATMALVVALGGSAYAANSIRSSDIVNGQVKRADIANNAVNSAKVANNSLRVTDFRSSDRASLRGPAGANGLPGAPGAKGDPGAPGAAGAPGAPATRLWAVINTTTDTLVRGSGATAVEDVSAGRSRVVFDRDVSQCAWLATVDRDSGEGYATVFLSGVSNTRVVAAAHNNAGTEVDRIMHVAVFC